MSLKLNIQTLQRNNNLKHTIRKQDATILKFKHDIQIIVHLKNEVVLTKEQTQVFCNHTIQALQYDAQCRQTYVHQLTSMEPYLSKHQLREYDNLFMQNTILKTKQKSIELGASDIEVQWNLVQRYSKKGCTCI